MNYRKMQTLSRRAQQEEFDLEHAQEQVLVQYREEDRHAKRGEYIKRFLKDALLKVLGKEESEDGLRLPKNHLNIRMLHINKVVTKK